MINSGVIKGSWCQLSLFVSGLLGGCREEPGCTHLPCSSPIPFSFPPRHLNLSHQLCFSPANGSIVHSSSPIIIIHFSLSLQTSISFLPLSLSVSNFHFSFPLLSSPRLCLFYVWCQVLFQGTSCDPCSHTSAPLCQALALYFFNEHRAEGEKRQINQRSHFHSVSKKKQIRRTEESQRL